MAEHRTTDRLYPASSEEQEAGAVTALDTATANREATDLVFAFSGGERLDLYGLSLLLTAQQIAHEDDRAVWVAGLSRRSWLLLEALGLEGLFKAFPPVGQMDA
jgi:hypothetical protein